GTRNLSFFAQDEFGNFVTDSAEITVAESTVLFALTENPLVTGGVIVALLVIGILVIGPFNRLFTRFSLGERKKRLLAQKNLLQSQYFSNAGVTKDAYQARLREIDDAVGDIDKQLEKRK
ncbi:MAG: hypothetical protein Q7R47_04240, partial [Candidatus Diapherotrites archaeon]|nr:hypothetical protein [Candidatus Diapherotrites archaeon]